MLVVKSHVRELLLWSRVFVLLSEHDARELFRDFNIVALFLRSMKKIRRYKPGGWRRVIINGQRAIIFTG